MGRVLVFRSVRVSIEKVFARAASSRKGVSALLFQSTF